MAVGYPLENRKMKMMRGVLRQRPRDRFKLRYTMLYYTFRHVRTIDIQETGPNTCTQCNLVALTTTTDVKVFGLPPREIRPCLT
jgi:hypothetical protein